MVPHLLKRRAQRSLKRLKNKTMQSYETISWLDARLAKADRVFMRIATAWAIAGGLIFVLLAIMTCISIVLRATTGHPVPGDYELIEFGTAIGIFMALPYTQMSREHIIVDLFTLNLAPRTRSNLDAIASFIFILVMATLTWRLCVGIGDIAQDRTLILRIPIVWGFLLVIPSIALATIACVLTFMCEMTGARQ